MNYVKLFVYNLGNFILFVGSLDIEDVEKLLDEIGTIKENEAKKQIDKSVPEANIHISSNNSNTPDDGVFSKLEILEPNKDDDNADVLEVSP